MKKYIVITVTTLLLSSVAQAQQLTLNEVIRIAQENSFDAQVAKL